MSNIRTKNTNPATVPTPPSGMTAFGTNLSNQVFIKDSDGDVTIIEGGVSSVSASSTTPAITITGSPITSSGTLEFTANEFTATDGGIVPASGGWPENFLRGDGIWAPPGGVTSFNTRTGDITLTSTDVTTALGFTPGSGTVTSVAASGNNGVSISGSPITSSGTINIGLGDITPTSVAASGTVSGSNLSGTNTGDQTITLTGDVTGSGTGSFAATIANDAVTNAKLANVPTSTFKGRTSAGTGDAEDLTATQATALLDTFTTGAKGLAPASGGGTTNFLRADGTWVAPSGGSGTVTSVDVSGGTTGISFSGGPITSSGTVTMGGTLAVANGGTGAATSEAAVNNLLPSQTGIAGRFLKTDGTNAVWSQVPRMIGLVFAATTTNIALTGAVVVDGITTSNGNRILVKNQTDTAQNGIYIADAGAWTLAPDNPTEGGAWVPVSFGTTGSATVWRYGGSGTNTWEQFGDQISLSPSGGTTGLTLTFGTSPLGAFGTRFNGRGNQNIALNLGGTLNVANGGTGLSSLTANNVILGNGTSSPSFVAPGTSGNVLTSNGTTWVSAPGGGGGGGGGGNHISTFLLMGA